MAMVYHAIERCPWTQRLLWDAGDDGIAILDELLIDDPCPQFLTGEPGRDPVRCRINIVCHHHVHHDPAAWCQTGADGVAGLRIKLLRESESGSSDVDRNAVVVCAVIEYEFSKVGDDTGQFVRQIEIPVREHETDRVNIDDGQSLAETPQPCRKISAATAQDEDLFGPRQEFVHELDVGEHAFAVWRRLALSYPFFEIHACTVPRTLDDSDLPIPPLITTQQFHGRQLPQDLSIIIHALNISYHVICGVPTISGIADNVSVFFNKNSIQVSGLNPFQTARTGR